MDLRARQAQDLAEHAEKRVTDLSFSPTRVSTAPTS